jgi:hypothetical protein
MVVLMDYRIGARDVAVAVAEGEEETGTGLEDGTILETLHQDHVEEKAVKDDGARMGSKGAGLKVWRLVVVGLAMWAALW